MQSLKIPQHSQTTQNKKHPDPVIKQKRKAFHRKTNRLGIYE